MKARNLIYELIQGSLDDEVRIYDVDTDKLYAVKIDTSSGYFDLFIRSDENEKGLSGMTVPSKPNTKYFQDDYNTNTQIKQVSLVSKEDLEELVRTLDRNIKSIEEGYTDNAIESLTSLRNGIEKHLGGIK